VRPRLAACGVVCVAFVILVATMSEASARATRSVARCGLTSSPFGPIGVYRMKGQVTCRHAEFLIHRAFYVEGTRTGAGDSELYHDGWVCGGQMGYFNCSKPKTLHPREAVEGLACHSVGVGCPRTWRE